MVKGRSKTKAFPDMTKFIKPFVQGLIEFLIGEKNVAMITEING